MCRRAGSPIPTPTQPAGWLAHLSFSLGVLSGFSFGLYALFFFFSGTGLIVLAVFFAWLFKANSVIYLVGWGIVAVPGSVFSIYQLFESRSGDKTTQRRKRKADQMIRRFQIEISVSETHCDDTDSGYRPTPLSQLPRSLTHLSNV